MNIIDETGRLFGRVNVYDAIVVLGVLGVLGVGIVLVGPFGGGGGGGESATRYATIHLGEYSPAVAERISAGDVADGYTATNDLTITDTYVGPAADGNVSVVVRARINGTVTERTERGDPVVEFADTPLQRGNSLGIETSAYEVTGEILELGTENDSLDVGTLSVLVRTDLSPTTAPLVDRGDTYRINGRTVATTGRTIVQPALNGTTANDFVGVSLRTIDYAGNTYFGGTQVTVGETIGFRTSQYAFSGTVARWGNTSLPGKPTNRTVVVKLANVRPGVATGIETGMVERRDGTTIATVTDVRTEPASVILTSDDGNIYERDHPRNRDVYLTVDLRVRETESGVRFRTRPLLEGSNVLLDFRTTVVNGTVTDIGQ